MDIFGIIGFSVLLVGLLLSISYLIEMACDDWGKTGNIIRYSVATVLFALCLFGGIGLNTESEKIYVKKYLAQKETIEASLKVEELSGLERIELVKQATELNGELAERKAQFELWHFVVYDNTIYDGVELINLKGARQ